MPVAFSHADEKIAISSKEGITSSTEKLSLSSRSDDEITKTDENSKPAPPFCGFGILCSFTNSILNASNSLLVKLISSIEPIEITASRCYVQFLIILPFLFYKWRKNGLDVLGPPGMFKFLVFRGCAGSVAALLFHQAVTRLPVGDAVTISFTNTVFAMFFGCVCLGEAVTLFDGFLALLTMAGVVCIAKPPFLMGSDDASYDSNTLYGVLFGIASAALHASTIIVIRKLGRTPALLNIFYYSIIGSFITSVITLATGVFRLPCTSDLPYVFLNGLIGVLCLWAMTATLKYERATTFTILRTAQIFFIFAMQVVILHDVPSVMSIIGASLVFVAMITLSIRKIYNQRRSQRADAKDE